MKHDRYWGTRVRRTVSLVVWMLLLAVPTACSRRDDHEGGGQARSEEVVRRDSVGAMKDAPEEIRALARELQGKEPDEMRETIIRRVGNRGRDVGFGLCIEQWDLAGGTLTLHPITGPVFERDGMSYRLMQTRDPAGKCLLGSYEIATLPRPGTHGSCFWFGNMTLSPDGRYHYRDQWTVPKRTLRSRRQPLHGLPRRDVQSRIRPRCDRGDALEDLADGTRIATITFVGDGTGRTRSR